MNCPDAMADMDAVFRAGNRRAGGNIGDRTAVAQHHAVTERTETVTVDGAGIDYLARSALDVHTRAEPGNDTGVVDGKTAG